MEQPGFSNKCDILVLGKSWVSLAYAALRKAAGEEVLVVADGRFLFGDKWNRYIGELEIKALSRLGKERGIECLENISRYLKRCNTVFLLNDKMIELGSSPYANLKELARKLPECFSVEFIKNAAQTEPEEFDRVAGRFFDRTLDEFFGLIGGNKDFFPGPGAGELEGIFQGFLEGLDNDSMSTKQLRYILQALYQTFLSNSLSRAEARFLLSRALSPGYEVDTQALEDELAFAFQSMGGALKNARIQDFEFYQNRLEYVLLDTFEGVVKCKRAALFGHFGKALPFSYPTEQTVYHSIEAHGCVDPSFAAQFKNKRLIFSDSDRMGTDFPHWEAHLDENNIMRATYVYALYEGAKADFYFKNAREDLSASLKKLFPGISKEEWTAGLRLVQGSDVWLNNPFKRLDGERLKVKSTLGSRVYRGGKEIKNIEYCGPLRARYLGLFGFILNVLN